MATIFHLALARDWAAAQETGAYTTSTRGRTVAEEGFIHASRGDQWPQVREAFYSDLAPEELVLLQVDTDLLDVPVVEEPAVGGAAETFPHIYGPLRIAAVVRALPLPSGASSSAAPTPQPPPSAPLAAPAAAPERPAPTESFARLYFREVFFNMAMVCIVLAVATLGVVLGGLCDGEAGPGLGALAGIVAGIVVAVLLYRRRHHREPAA